MKNLKPNQFLLAGILITERPILFQNEMVKANMEDRKTQSRRGFNQPSYLTNSNQQFKRMGFVNGNPQKYAAAIGGENFSTLFESKYGKPGDLLWVRETWARIEGRYYFKADGAEDEIIQEYSLEKINWKPSIHMPKSASRIWLMIEDIRVERVQDISEEDAIAEGIRSWFVKQEKSWAYYFYPCKDLRDDSYLDSPITSFYSLWRSINGDASWQANPWVWVIKYRILSKTGRPSNDLILQNYLEVTNLKSTL